MQTQPAKNRTLAVAGAILLALLVAGIALWSGGDTTPPEATGEEADVQSVDGLTTEDLATAEGTDLVDELAEAEPASPDETTDLMGEEESLFPTDEGDETELSVTPALGEVPLTHTVQLGETLSSISEMYYGSHIYFGDIERINDLEDPNRILVGQELQLPRPEELLTETQEEPAQ